MLGEVDAGQLRKAAVGYIDSSQKLRLLDLSQSLIFPLKLGKANKVGRSTRFHGVKSDSYTLLETTGKMSLAKRTAPLAKLENVYFFSEWQEMNILSI